jgi:hypothetical protein
VNALEATRDSFPADTLEAALLYASLGWKVIPLEGKRPYLKSWPKKASTSEKQIHIWFSKSRNLGITTGSESGLVVLDIDPRNGGELNLKRLEEQYGKLPVTITAVTGGGGWHYYFRWFEDARLRKPAPGIDFQCSDGHQVVAAPSIHPESGIAYEWSKSPLTQDLADLPTAWKSMLSGSSALPAPDCTQVVGSVSHLFSGDIPVGTRNNTLFQLGCALRNEGNLSKTIAAALNETNINRCSPPLSPSEVYEILESVLRRSVTGKSMKTQWQERLMGDGALTHATKIVGMTLSLFANEHGGNCFPNQDQVGIASGGMARNTVRKHVEILIEQGWVYRYMNGREGHGYSYGYTLKLKDAQKSQ